MKNLRFSVLLLFMSNLVYAEPSLVCKDLNRLDVEDTSLEQLMDVPIVLGASQQAACTNEAANIISSISGKEILTRGARDLTDVLQLVPGFFLGNDMSNIESAGIRGMATNDGKMSVFVDGIMLTERIYGSNVFGGHFPIEQIDRVEIIRGSSSITSGNFAEMGAINIITKNAKKADGLAVTADYGRFERGEARKNISVAAGKVFDDLEISFSGKSNESQRSDRIYTDAHGGSIDMANNSQLDSLYGNLNLKYKELNIRLLSDDYNVEGRDGFADKIRPAGNFLRNEFTTHAAQVEFEHPFNDNFKANADFNFARQKPWERYRVYDDKTKPPYLSEKTIVDNYKFNTKATWMADSGSYVTLGNSYQMDDYSLVAPVKTILPTFANYTAYTEGVYKTAWGDFLGGLRFDYYNQFGTNFAPRFALTKQLDKFHYKLLYTHAFHAPTAGNYELNREYNQSNKLGQTLNSLSPEHTETYEIELGYDFTRNFEIVTNIFMTRIKDLLTYGIDSNANQFYVNGTESDVYGFESGLKYKNETLGYFDLNYSFYQAHQHKASQYYQAFRDGEVIHPQMNLGFPTHKATLNHTFNFTHDLSFNHNLVFFSDRFGYSGTELKHYKPDWIYNAYLRYQNMPIKGAEIGLGLYDVFNARYQYVQQYNGSHPALPAEARELMLRLSYQF